MPWQDRLISATYFDPTGSEFPFTYERTDVEQDRKTNAVQVPGADGTFVQDLGSTGRRFPLSCIFHGGDHDRQAQAFVDALTRPGFGVLVHPFLGRINVVPYGTIKTQNDLVGRRNETSVRVTFWETRESLYPSPVVDPEAKIVFETASMLDRSISFFEDNVVTRTVDDVIAVQNAVLDTVYAVQDEVTGLVVRLTRQVERAKAGFRAILAAPEAISRSPGSVVAQLATTIGVGSKSDKPISEVLSEYQSLVGTIQNRPQANINDALVAAHVVAACHGAVLQAVVTAQLRTRDEALEAAATVLDDLSSRSAWIETALASYGLTPDVATYSSLRDASAFASRFLVEQASELISTRTVYLNREWSPLALCFHLTGTTKGFGDFLRANRVVGLEHMSLPEGRRIVYLA